MKRAERNFFIGTSGWNYETFIGTLYERSTPQRKYLECYTKFFNTVELNASFYRSFPKKTWEGWYKRTPKDFLWSVKASRFITHIKRLNADEESIDKFFSMATILKEKLAVVLFQLPPSLEYDQKVFDAFLSLLPNDVRISLEPRHDSWFKEEVYAKLKKKNIALVFSHTAGRYPFKEVYTADFLYIRLHGMESLYRGAYGYEGLRPWIKIIESFSGDSYIYFDNTADGSAAQDALLLKKILHEHFRD